MKCPMCGAPTEVKATKRIRDVIWRRRICFNEHSFGTEEKSITQPKPKRVIKAK